jgi:glycogen debranching enzyme
MNKAGSIPMSGVKIHRHGREMEVRFDEWANKMKANFERCFWVPTEKFQDNKYDITPKYANRRGIYKDVYGS